MHLIDLLQARGFLKDLTDPEGLRARLDEGPVTFYTGYDPTADSLTAGHMVQLMFQAHAQRAGHRPIVVMGGGTAMLGDPSGKSATRESVPGPEDIARNLAGMRPQIGRFLDLAADVDEFNSPGSNKALVVDNADWLSGLNYIDFLRDVGRHFSVNEMLQAEVYAARLRNSQHLSFVEFNYRLVQAFDFFHLHQRFGCELQLGGSDQWGNLVAGTELIRKKARGKAWGITTALLATADGSKMGKTEQGALWLDPQRTSPYDFFQYWLNVDDRDVGKFLRMFTFLPLERVAELEALQGAEIRQAKRVLAREVTTLVHGAEECSKADEAARALFGGGRQDAKAIPTVTLERARFEQGVQALELFVIAGLCKSNGEARRLVKQGGARIDDHKVADPFEVVGLDRLDDDGGVLLRAGKKRYCKVVAG